MSNFTPTLDGLYNIEASGVSSDTIITNNFIALVSAKVPTVDTTSNDEDAANTFYVNRAIYNESLKYVTLSGYQDINGIKNYINLPISNATPTINNQLINKLYCDTEIINNGLRYVTISGNQLINGVKSFNSLPISDAIPSTNNQLINKLYADNQISNINLENSLKYVTLSGNQTIYQIKSFYECPQILKQPVLNYDAVNKLYIDDVIAEFNGSLGLSGFVQLFATLAGDQTFTTGTKTFTNYPVCAATPTLNNQLVNKLYIDNAINSLNLLESISGLVTISTNQIITGQKSFTNPIICNLNNFTSEQLINKNYVDNRFLSLYSDQTISGIILCSQPLLNEQIVNKQYVDDSINNIKTISGLASILYVSENYVNYFNDQTISGIINFSKLPICNLNAVNNNELVNKQYVDNLFYSIPTISGIAAGYATINYVENNYLKLTSNQTVSGIINFNQIPICNINAVNNNELVNKQYVDNLFNSTISGGIINGYASINYVDNNFLNLNANQTISGIILCTQPITLNNQIVNKQYVDATNGPSILPLNNTFTGNNTFWPTTSNTIIRGDQVDIFPTITYLTSPTTSIAGDILNCNSTQNWFNGDYTNLNSIIQTTMRSPVTLVANTCNNFNVDSSNILISSTTRNFNINCEKTNFNSIITVPDLTAGDYSNQAVNSKFVNDYAVSISLLPLNNQWTGINTYYNTTTISGPLNVKSDLITLGSETNTSKIIVKQNTAALNPGNIGYSLTISGSLTWSNVGSLNYFNVGSFQAPPYQVSLISLSVQFILNSTQTLTIHGSVVSESATVSAVPQPIAGGFYYASQADIPLAELATGTPAAVAPLCGVYNNGTSSAITLYVKAQLFQNYTIAPRVSYIGTVSKIG
jgi:hypothetical protein